MGGLKSSSMNSNGDNMWKFYSEDSPGVKVNSNLSGSVAQERTEFHFVRRTLNDGGFTLLSDWTSSSFGIVIDVHWICIHHAHLGKIQSSFRLISTQ